MDWPDRGTEMKLPLFAKCLLPSTFGGLAVAALLLAAPLHAEPTGVPTGPVVPGEASAAEQKVETTAEDKPRTPIEVRYVTDRLILGMKANPQGTGKNLKLLKSGTRLEILEKRGAYSLVRTPDGTEGWAKSAFMVKDKPAILVVEEYKAEIKRLEDEIKRLEAGGKRVEIRPDPAQKQRILELEQALAEARTQLRELKERPAGATKSAAETPSTVPGAPADSRETSVWLPVILALGGGLLIGAGLAWWLYDRRLRRRFAGLRV